jgi:hypothetical protein
LQNVTDPDPAGVTVAVKIEAVPAVTDPDDRLSEVTVGVAALAE